VELFHVDDLNTLADHQMVLDVRTPREVAFGTIPGATNIPLDQLRENLDQLSKEKEWLVSCQVGIRGYLACRILKQHGYRCRNLSGGYRTWQMSLG
jgi:rhodanese-related sulfurtransferase